MATKCAVRDKVQEKEAPKKLLERMGKACGMLSISRFTGHRLAREGRMKTVMIGGQRMVPVEEIARLSREGTGRVWGR